MSEVRPLNEASQENTTLKKKKKLIPLILWGHLEKRKYIFEIELATLLADKD